MLLRSTNTPVNAHKKSPELPPKNSGIPGRVYVNALMLRFSLWKRTGKNTFSRMFRD
jgi:hypothetical protein